MPAAHIRSQEEDTAAETRQAKRYAKRALLAKASTSSKSRQALRLMVTERLSHPLLEQMHSSDFERNPLAVAEDEGEDAQGQSVSQWMTTMTSDSEGGDGESDAPTGSNSGRGIDELVALKQHVQANDDNGDGLDNDEFVRTLGEIWVNKSPQELSRLFMQIDADSDGRVTWEELLTFLLQQGNAADDEPNRVRKP